jgi:hypothetical protein
LVGLGALAATRRREVPDAGTLMAHDPLGGAWLQVVAGGSRIAVARAAFELAARSLARRERVVIVDAAPRLRLHRPLRLSPRLGWSECARQGLPALGVVQNGGFTGLFVLAHGRAARVVDWLPLDRVLEELRPHFGRVILAFDDSAPVVVGGVLAGRIMDGWWAGPGRSRDRNARRLSDHLAIALHDMSLPDSSEATLEGMARRLAELGAEGPPEAEPESGPSEPALDDLPPGSISEPAVLDCDLQIRQRLRFMAWMRRVQVERRRRELETADRP